VYISNPNQSVSKFFCEILNLAFKYDIDLRDEDHQKYKGFSLYYGWLLDMEAFNYKNFDPLWILEYQTVYYLRKIFRSKKVKDYLVPYLKKSKHERLSELFIEYTNETARNHIGLHS
jgi:hypothetical protein